MDAGKPALLQIFSRTVSGLVPEGRRECVTLAGANRKGIAAESQDKVGAALARAYLRQRASQSQARNNARRWPCHRYILHSGYKKVSFCYIITRLHTHVHSTP